MPKVCSFGKPPSGKKTKSRNKKKGSFVLRLAANSQMVKEHSRQKKKKEKLKSFTLRLAANCRWERILDKKNPEKFYVEAGCQ